MNKSIIVLGATGAVGAYTALYLKEKAYNVIAVGRRESDNNFFEEHGIEYISVDIQNIGDFDSLPKENIYGIIHLAGFLPANMEGYDPQVYIDVNITGTLNMLQYAKNTGVERVVYATSFSDVCHLWGTEKPIDPDATTGFPLNNDHSVYSISKNTGANLVKQYSAQYGFRHYILRFPNVYLYHPASTYYVNGVKQGKGMFNVIEEAKRGEDIELWGSPTRVRDMVYVKDCIQIIEKCFSSDALGGTYNVGTGIGTSRQDQLRGIVEVFSPKGQQPKIIDRADLPDSPQYIMDVDKTKKELGYEPKFGYIAFLEDVKVEMQENRFESLWGKG